MGTGGDGSVYGAGGDVRKKSVWEQIKMVLSTHPHDAI